MLLLHRMVVMVIMVLRFEVLMVMTMKMKVLRYVNCKWLLTCSPSRPWPFLAIKTDALQTCEVSVTIYPTTQCNVPEDLNLYQHHFEIIKSCGYEDYILLRCETALPSRYKHQQTVTERIFQYINLHPKMKLKHTKSMTYA